MAGARFHFDVGNYVTMLRLVHAETDKSRRRKLLAVFVIGVPAMAALHAVCFALDPVLFPSLRRTEVHRNRSSAWVMPAAERPTCID